MKKVEADGFSFVFSDAIDAFVFDEKDKTKPMYHGLPMKRVDIIAELANEYVYVEMKYFHDSNSDDEASTKTDNEKSSSQAHFKWLKNYLKYKFRDSYLFRHAEQKVDKPIHYICLLTFDNALNTRMQKALKQELPCGMPSSRWSQAIVKSCQVMNVERWNANFPKWPVMHLSATATTPAAALEPGAE